MDSQDVNFQQLYYTSCRTGLSGYAGYQFNAVTPGVAPETMNEVERLSAYEPPGALEHSPTPEQIGRCPVNLWFVPGPTPIAAHVVFIGTDYSGRFGNYFAHAIAPVDGAWPGPPPIELWGARFWSSETVDGTDLAPLRAPLPTGPIGRREIDAFLDSASGRSLLPALLAAAEHAVLDENRSVVIRAADAGEAARWIAAASYLLPPPLVPRMSFATYQFRPAYSRHHLIGTVPGSDLEPDERAFHAYYLFDFTTGAATPVEAGPLPQLLAGIGAGPAEELWRQALALAGGGEERLADFYPLVVAAVLLGDGMGLDSGDIGAVCTWLAGSAARLDPGAVRRVAAAALDHEGSSPSHLAGLVDAAAVGGLEDLLGIAEERLVAVQLAQAARSGGPIEPLPARLRSGRVRESAAREYGRMIAASGSTAAVLRLLGAARAHDVRPDSGVLRECGLRLVGPAMLDDPRPPEPYEALRTWPDLRSGTLDHLDRIAATDRARLLAAFRVGLDEIARAGDPAGFPSLREALLLYRASRDPARRVDTAVDLVRTRGPRGRLDEALLYALWPGGWTAEEATAVLRRLPDGADADPALLPWFDRLLDDIGGLTATDPTALDAYGALCDALNRSRLLGMFSQQNQDFLKAMAQVRGVEERLAGALESGSGRKTVAASEALVAAYRAKAHAAAAPYLRARIALLALSLPPAPASRMLFAAPDDVRAAHLALLDARLRGEDAASDAAAAYIVSYEMRATLPGAQGGAVEELLARHLRQWPPRALNAVEREVKRRSGRASEDFKRWRLMTCGARRRWLPSLPNLPGLHGRK